jgi:hypothetical protein
MGLVQTNKVNSADMGLVSRVNTILTVQEERRRQKEGLEQRIATMKEELKEKSKLLDNLIKASTLIGNVADENVQLTLDRITGVINKALALLFKEDSRKIFIRQIMYQNVYPHYNVVMEMADGTERSFNLEGSGIAQVISYLFTICLIDANKGRMLFIEDELLSGLHPDAKVVISELLTVLARNYQIILVEYGIDIGKQYEIKRSDGSSFVDAFQGRYSPWYYKDIALRQMQGDETGNSYQETAFTRDDEGTLVIPS